MSPNDVKQIWDTKVAALPLQAPAIVGEHDAVSKCIETMQYRNLGYVVIVDETQNVKGIFTDKDVMARYIATSIPPDAPIKDIMTTTIYRLDPDATIADAVEIFGEHHFRHLLICKNGTELLGMLSIRALASYIAENLPESILNLPPDESIVSQEPAGA